MVPPRVDPTFPIETALDRLAPLVRRLPKAAMFQLADEGRRSVFEQVVACMISVRTLEEETLRASRALFDVAASPDLVAELSADQIQEIIHRSTFADRKAGQIKEIARRTVEEHGGALPCDEQVLRDLPGIGPKCANLTLGVACGVPRVSVDVHVHRVVNRWGAVRTSSPEQTLAALEETLPPDRWISVNQVLMPFGKYWCTFRQPRCSDCPVNDICRKVGVTSHR